MPARLLPLVIETLRDSGYPVHEWTLTEILAEPPLTDGRRWFYGVVRERTRLVLAEVYPGYGYAHCPDAQLMEPHLLDKITADLRDHRASHEGAEARRLARRRRQERRRKTGLEEIES